MFEWRDGCQPRSLLRHSKQQAYISSSLYCIAKETERMTTLSVRSLLRFYSIKLNKKSGNTLPALFVYAAYYHVYSNNVLLYWFLLQIVFIIKYYLYSFSSDKVNNNNYYGYCECCGEDNKRENLI